MRSSVFASLLFGLTLATGCSGGGSDGGGTGNPAAPTPSPAPSPNPAPSGATITIASNAVSSQRVEIAVGSRVTFVNNDSRAHEMHSDPHPIHTDCQEINAVGPIAPGETKQTGAFATARTCGFHDHGQPEVAALQGVIVVR